MARIVAAEVRSANRSELALFDAILHLAARAVELLSSLLPAADVKYCTGRPLSRASNNEASLSCSVSHRPSDRRGRPYQQALICVLTAVEPCWSYEIVRDRASKRIEAEPRYRKCPHLCYYQIHPRFGFMSARIQTWVPFGIQICVNGRE